MRLILHVYVVFVWCLSVVLIREVVISNEQKE